MNLHQETVKKRVLETSCGKLLMEPFDKKTPESSLDSFELAIHTGIPQETCWIGTWITTQEMFSGLLSHTTYLGLQLTTRSRSKNLTMLQGLVEDTLSQKYPDYP